MKTTKDATIKVSLKADSGYSSTGSGRVSPQQWGAICAIIADKPTKAEQDRDKLLSALIELYDRDTPENRANARAAIESATKT